MSRLRPDLTMENLDPLMSYPTADVAKVLGYAKTSLRRLIREKRIKAYCPNEWEYRILGSEVQRVHDLLMRGERLPKPSLLEQGRVNVIEVEPELARIICPDWQPIDED